MAADYIKIHHITPENNKIKKAAEFINNGAVILYPADTGFSLGCRLSDKNAIEKLRKVRNISNNHSLTFLTEDLSNVSTFAKVSDKAYKTIKGLIPGPFTFILPASREVPKLAQNPKRQTSGIRVPDSKFLTTLIKEVGSPIISSSARIEGDDEFIPTPDEIIEFYGKQVDLVIEFDEYNFYGESTVLDMTTDEFVVIREGAQMEKVEEFM